MKVNPLQSEVEEALCTAIASRLVVMIRMKGEDRLRMCHPHIVYEAPTGRRLVEVHQVEGPSESRRPTLWRSLAIADISQVQILTEPFSPADDFNPENRDRYANRICWIAKDQTTL